MTEAPDLPVNIHGTGLVLDGVGLLLRGPSGAGKSLLALTLLDRWQQRDRAACLVADDRIDLDRDGPHLMMRRPERIAGLIELRGRGIIRRPSAAAARLDLIVDLVDDLERMPPESAFRIELFGVGLDRCPAPPIRQGESGWHQVLLVEEALRELSTAKGSGEKTT